MRLSGQILLGFSLVIGLSLTDSYVNHRLSQKVNTNTAFLARSEAVIRNSGRLHKSVIEMQSAFRGYLLTDDKAFLNAYYNGNKELPAIFREQTLLVRESGLQTARLKSIQRLHQEWIDYSLSLIEARQKVDKQPGVYADLFNNKLRKQVGKRINDKISDIFRDFDRSEYKIRQARRVALNQSIERTRTISLVFLIFTVGVGLISTIYIVRLITKRIALMVDLADNISKGRFTEVNDVNNDELTGLSTSLNLMSKTLKSNIDQLEKRNKELNQYAYVVSHDLKAPIRGIYNVTQWIEEDLGAEVSSQMRKYLNIIHDRMHRMENLISGLLDYARVNREQHVKEVVDVNVLIAELRDLLVPEGTRFITSNLPVFKTERIRLEQVFGNLISNAVKFSGSNPEISISARDLGNTYEFTVADKGMGIDPQFHDKIFDIFQTLREKNDKESTGIGLSIVKKILDDQHCSITVDSKTGQGASFIFSWPKN